jgi:Zn-dependent protease
MPSLRFSRAGLNLYSLPHIDFAQIFFGFVVLLFSLTVHEMAHAWTADRLGDPTARLLGRVSLNPIVHADLVGTVIFPLIAMISGVPLIGWAKPVPVNPRQLGHPRRDFMLVAAAGPASNLVMAVGAAMVLRLLPVSPVTLGEPNLSVPIASLLGQAMRLNVLLAVFNMVPIPPLDGGNVLSGLLPRRLGYQYNAIVRPYGFLLIYVLMFSRGFEYLVIPPSRLLISWLQ